MAASHRATGCQDDRPGNTDDTQEDDPDSHGVFLGAPDCGGEKKCFKIRVKDIAGHVSFTNTKTKKEDTAMQEDVASGCTEGQEDAWVDHHHCQEL